MKILFAVDGSPQALAALETLVGKFGFFRETPKLTLIHVHPPVPYKAAAAWVGKATIERYYDEESDAALAGDNLFAVLMDVVRVCSLGEITEALFEVGGRYRRNV